jgi:hypothetical protein
MQSLEGGSWVCVLTLMSTEIDAVEVCPVPQFLELEVDLVAFCHLS